MKKHEKHFKISENTNPENMWWDQEDTGRPAQIWHRAKRKVGRVARNPLLSAGRKASAHSGA